MKTLFGVLFGIILVMFALIVFDITISTEVTNKQLAKLIITSVALLYSDSKLD